MRTLPEDIKFAKYLLEVGNGMLNDKDDIISAPEQCISDIQEDIVETIFKDLIFQCKYDELMKMTMLSARNVDIDEINCRVVALLDKDSEKDYTGMDSTENRDKGNITDFILPEYLNSLNPPNFPPYELKLRNIVL